MSSTFYAPDKSRPLIATPRDLSHGRLANNDDALRPVLGYAHDWPFCEHFSIACHSHLRAQLIFATEGVLRVSTATSAWVVPPQLAVWVPPAVEHAMTANGAFILRTLYLHPSVKVSLPDDCCVIAVSPLLRELILHAVRASSEQSLEKSDAMVMALIPELLGRIAPEPLQLPLPVDRRLRVVAEALLDDPSHKEPLTYWAQRVGASERTLLRHFTAETGMSYNEWRKRLRLVHAITLLSKGSSVTATAYALGYDSPSAFVAMFRRELGCPPGRYLSSQLMRQ